MLEDRSIEDIMLSAGKGSREDTVEMLTIKWSWMGGRGVGQRGHSMVRKAARKHECLHYAIWVVKRVEEVA